MMLRNKDAYYFPHDSNAKDDPKCVMLIERLGLEGYGIYWVLVETLRDQPGYSYPMELLPALARRYNTSTERMNGVVCDYGLFEIGDGTMFCSPSLTARMSRIDDRRRTLSDAGRRGNEKRWSVASRSDGNSVAIGRRSQVKKTKPDQSTVNNDLSENMAALYCCEHETEPEELDMRMAGLMEETSTGRHGRTVGFCKPTLEEVAAYCAERGNMINHAVFHDFYESKGWMVGSSKMKDWRAAVRTWEQKEKARQPEPQPSYKPLTL